MNGHQNEAFSCLIGALNSPRKVNGYGADYALKDFRAKKHIRGVRLHLIPESYEGSQELYKDITFEKDRNYVEE